MQRTKFKLSECPPHAAQTLRTRRGLARQCHALGSFQIPMTDSESSSGFPLLTKQIQAPYFQHSNLTSISFQSLLSHCILSSPKFPLSVNCPQWALLPSLPLSPCASPAYPSRTNSNVALSTKPSLNPPV